MERRRTWLAAVAAAAVLACTLPAGTGRAATAAAVTAGPCGGAPLPPNYAITNGRPHQIKTPYADNTLYNPVDISLFVLAVFEDARTTAAQRLCLGELGGTALLAGSETRTVPGTGATARVYLYRFPFRENPSTPVLQPPWLSALAQGEALSSLSLLADRTGDATWDTRARESFEAFQLTGADAVVTRSGGRTWFQLYPTTPSSYVLNGNDETLLAVRAWAARTGDPRATALAADVQRTVDGLLPSYQVQLPMGTATSYDLLRGYRTAYLEALATGSLAVSSARVLRTNGTAYAALPLRAGRPTSGGPELTTNGLLPLAAAGHLPAGWRRIVTTSGSTVTSRREGGVDFVRTSSSGRGWEAWGQDVAASRLVPGQSYRVTLRSRLLVPAGRDGTSGRVGVVGLCPTGSVTLLDFAAMRGAAWHVDDFVFTMPRSARCGLRLLFYQADWQVVGSMFDVDAVWLRKPPSAVGAVQVPLPLSVLDEPTPRVQLTYTGSGWLGAWSGGRWTRLADLPAATGRTVVVDLPAQFQGRHVNLGYHELHVLELWRLWHDTADAVARRYGLAWQPLAPSHHSLVF